MGRGWSGPWGGRGTGCGAPRASSWLIGCWWRLPSGAGGWPWWGRRPAVMERLRERLLPALPGLELVAAIHGYQPGSLAGPGGHPAEPASRIWCWWRWGCPARRPGSSGSTRAARPVDGGGRQLRCLGRHQKKGPRLDGSPADRMVVPADPGTEPLAADAGRLPAFAWARSGAAETLPTEGDQLAQITCGENAIAIAQAETDGGLPDEGQQQEEQRNDRQDVRPGGRRPGRPREAGPGWWR